LQKKREKTCCNKTKIEGNDSSVVPFFAVFKTKTKGGGNVAAIAFYVATKKEKKRLIIAKTKTKGNGNVAAYHLLCCNKKRKKKAYRSKNQNRRWQQQKKRKRRLATTKPKQQREEKGLREGTYFQALALSPT
jgi:hypothetical protein